MALSRRRPTMEQQPYARTRKDVESTITHEHVQEAVQRYLESGGTIKKMEPVNSVPGPADARPVGKSLSEMCGDGFHEI